MILASSRDFVAGLRAAGLRVTPVRLALLTLASEPGHHDAEYLMRAARERLGAVSVQGVYDGLRALEQAGLVRRIQPAGGPSRFETRVGDNHHHVVCRGCGATDDVDCAHGAAPCLQPSSSHGFVIDEAEVTYWGLCPSCQAGSAVTSKKRMDTQEASDD